MKRKGIILAGGSGTRLFPITKAVSKQLMPIYDKPMIYYPLSVLMLADIREILIISTPHDLPLFKKLLGDGSQLGLSFSYAAQPKPEGLAQAFLIGEKFLNGDPACLILGDNLFYGANFTDVVRRASNQTDEATIFGYHVAEPTKYGVIGFDSPGKVASIEEKPAHPKSNYVVPGIYFYDSHVVKYTKKLKPSKRGELEITDLNNVYLKKSKLKVELLGRGIAWLDTGTHESLQEAAQFISVIQHRQGIKVACIEAIAFEKRWINMRQLEKLIYELGKNEYSNYLEGLLKELIFTQK